jgi:hypothetical protein
MEPLTVAVVPDAVLVKLMLADPAPPATASSSVSLQFNQNFCHLLKSPPRCAAWLSAIRRNLRAVRARAQPGMHLSQALVTGRASEGVVSLRIS